MTRENRTEAEVCPECDNNPIVMGDGHFFCDCCNEEFTRAELVKLTETVRADATRTGR